jgi:DNA-binding response OmpR family regulator
MRNNVRPDYVLVIDDDPEIREALEIACRMHGYEVLVANDENEAMEVMTSYEPALVLVDYYGIADNTRTLIQRIKAFDSRVPIVLMTGAQECRKKMTELGLTKHLAKPFSMESLLSVLKKCRVRSSRNVSEPVAFSLFS